MLQKYIEHYNKVRAFLKVMEILPCYEESMITVAEAAHLYTVLSGSPGEAFNSLSCEETMNYLHPNRSVL